MLGLGHAGITLGAVALAANLFGNSAASRLPGRPRCSWWLTAARKLDFRFLLVGSLLPDIIDKPLGIYLLRDSLGNGRIFAHTLLFLILISLSGWFLYRARKQSWLLVLAAGSGAHLILDRMWQNPRTLLWPLLGTSFDRIDVENWLPGIWNNLLTNPFTYISEMLGGLLLAWFAVCLFNRGTMTEFVKSGKIRHEA